MYMHVKKKKIVALHSSCISRVILATSAVMRVMCVQCYDHTSWRPAQHRLFKIMIKKCDVEVVENAHDPSAPEFQAVESHSTVTVMEKN